jgi:hypothetical protein
MLTFCFHIRLYEPNDERNALIDPDYSDTPNRSFLLKILLKDGEPLYVQSHQFYQIIVFQSLTPMVLHDSQCA